jgi:hypothetical protein
MGPGPLFASSLPGLPRPSPACHVPPRLATSYRPRGSAVDPQLTLSLQRNRCRRTTVPGVCGPGLLVRARWRCCRCRHAARDHPLPTEPSSRTPATGTASVAPKTVNPKPGTSTTPALPPTYGSAHTLTASDSGATIRLSVGESISLSLPAEYDPPISAGDALVRTATAGGYPTTQPLHTTFIAVRAGDADISSTTDYPCLYTTPPCMIVQRLWRVHVTVTH